MWPESNDHAIDDCTFFGISPISSFHSTIRMFFLSLPPTLSSSLGYMQHLSKNHLNDGNNCKRLYPTNKCL